MKKICIIHNENKKNAKIILEDIRTYLANQAVKLLSTKEIEKADFVIVIGGDGTLLRAFQKIKNKDTKIVAINAGTLGFITEIRKDFCKNIIDDILNNEFNIEERYFLKVKIGSKIYEALNEVYLTKDNIKRNIVSSEIYVENKFLSEFKGDGVILATPTGSTAYSLSAGGPVVTPELRLFLITPIAPHNLNTRPLILSGDLNIHLNLSAPSEQAYITIDGNIHHKISRKDTIEINYSTETLKLVIPKNRNYFEVLREKLKWGENLC